MNTVLWIIQAVLALMFLMAGFMKVTKDKEFLREKVGGWVDGFNLSQIKMIGFVEFLGALGLILPGLTNILPVLTAVAAFGLSLTMLFAGFVHLKRKEYKSIMTNAVLLALALFVAIQRFGA